MVESPPKVKVDDERGKPFAAFNVTEVDLAHGAAKLLGNGVMTFAMSAFETKAGVHFLTQGLDGSVSLLSVFADSARGLDLLEYAAVWSDHSTLIFAPPLPSQYHGTCRPLQ